MTAREQLMATLTAIRDQYLEDRDEFAAEEQIRDAIDEAADADATITLTDASEVENLLGYGEVNFAISAMLRYLRKKPRAVAEDYDLDDPLTADIWDDVDEDEYYDDLTDEEIAALTAEGPNYAEFSDHHYQEGCEGENCEEAYYGKGEIHDGDISSKISFVEAISRRFHNMGFDEKTHGLKPGSKDQGWNPYKENSVVMFGPSKEFFTPITDYIASEVTNEGSAWYNRGAQVVAVTDAATRTIGGDNYIFVCTFTPEKLTRLLNINEAWAEHFEGAVVYDATAEDAPSYARGGYRSYMFGPDSAYFYRLIRWFDGFIEHGHPEADARSLRLPYSERRNGKQAFALCISVTPDDFDPPKKGTGAELKKKRAAAEIPAEDEIPVA